MELDPKSRKPERKQRHFSLTTADRKKIDIINVANTPRERTQTFSTTVTSLDLQHDSTKGKETARSNSSSPKTKIKPIKPEKSSKHARLIIIGSKILTGTLNFALHFTNLEIHAELPLDRLPSILIDMDLGSARNLIIPLMDKYYFEWNRRYNQYILVDARKGEIPQKFTISIKYSLQIRKWLIGLSYY